jgi:hypothetical protein
MGTPDWFMEIMEIIDKWGYHGNKKENTGITGGYNGVLVGYIYIIKYNKIYIYIIYYSQPIHDQNAKKCQIREQETLLNFTCRWLQKIQAHQARRLPVDRDDGGDKHALRLYMFL